ncbi:MAG: HipA domain-containing protein [Tannerellaceae bacterium]|jgi:serine/threonine-protein kinase HipA|nr:HipA domain-containing protein [Tannerellaceae bacterium]
MKAWAIDCCPGSLAEGYATYSPSCLGQLFEGRKVSHILPYDPPHTDNEADTEQFIENRRRISISGVQEKVSLRLEKNVLRLTREGEQGLYILKPLPRDVKRAKQAPANEHLTMQIARQVYGIHTAENAMIFFKDGTPAYITKRFDIKKEGEKWGKEDFASLAGKTKDNAGADFKYDSNYEEAGSLIKKYVSAWQGEIEKYMGIVLFNYLFSNGDGHLKNFSLIESAKGDYLLSPAYDLINSRLHVNDSDFALCGGLFADAYKSEAYKKYNHACKTDFIELANRLGMAPSRMEKLLARFLEKPPLVASLVHRSFFPESEKQVYYRMYETRMDSLRKE